MQYCSAGAAHYIYAQLLVQDAYIREYETGMPAEAGCLKQQSGVFFALTSVKLSGT